MNIKKSITTLTTLVIFILSLSSSVAFAGDLQQAKSDGWIGEQNNGYIGFVTPGASEKLQTTVLEVNSKRRAIYAKLATKQRISLGKLEAVAGERNIKKTPSGQFIQDASGNWVKKK